MTSSGYAGGGGKSLSKLLCELLWIRCFVFDGKGQETKVRRFSEFEIQSNSNLAIFHQSQLIMERPHPSRPAPPSKGWKFIISVILHVIVPLLFGLSGVVMRLLMGFTSEFKSRSSSDSPITSWREEFHLIKSIIVDPTKISFFKDFEIPFLLMFTTICVIRVQHSMVLKRIGNRLKFAVWSWGKDKVE